MFDRVGDVSDAGRSVHLRTLVGSIRPVALAGQRQLPLDPALTTLFPPGGLQRGSTVVVGTGSTRAQGTLSLALALAAGVSSSGSWCAAVGLAELGVLAAAELGVALHRLALVPRVDPTRWTATVGTLLDTVDLVLARPPAHLRPGDARRLTARARERGSVLVPVLTDPVPAGPWAEGADMRLTVQTTTWYGPGTGEGHLSARLLEIATGGRRAAARPRSVELWLPALDGRWRIADRPAAETPPGTHRLLDLDVAAPTG